LRRRALHVYSRRNGADIIRETALLHVMNRSADQKKATVLVDLDLSAAFNTINHDVLISRL